jgi:hypothetical protein
MIKATELQIGDFVLIDGTPRKVEAITKKKIGYHRKENEPRLYYARLHDVEPIEINEYVLRISGFCLDETVKTVFARFDNDKVKVEVVLFKNANEDPQVIITNKDTHSCYVGGTRYVHEFQHLFRPCGVNFEVKL